MELMEEQQLEKLTPDRLVDCIRTLKDSLTAFDGERIRRKVLFFDDWSLYRRVREYVPTDSFTTMESVGELLDLVEPYIPYRLSEENFGIFMQNVSDYAHGRTETESEEQLAHKAKLDFVLTLRAVKNATQWQGLLAACESIRAIKDDMQVSQVWVC